jgi:hypothetical protein
MAPPSASEAFVINMGVIDARSWSFDTGELPHSDYGNRTVFEAPGE